MKLLITQALQERRLVQFRYQSKVRTVAPHALGATPDGQGVFLGRQIWPPITEGRTWRLFDLAEISNGRLLEFHVPPPSERQSPPLDGLATIHLTLRT